MGQLSTPELHGVLDPITVFQELDRPPDLRLEIALTDLRLEANFLEGDRALAPLGFLLALRQLVLVLAEVEKPDHRRRRHRGDLDEIVAPVLRHREGQSRGHDAKLCTLFVDDPHLWYANHLVYAQVSADGCPLVAC